MILDIDVYYNIISLAIKKGMKMRKNFEKTQKLKWFKAFQINKYFTQLLSIKYYRAIITFFHLLNLSRA